jgi:predicted ATPase/class 3 adenylate cyclase
MEVPSGTVTLLFTDIEGSTRLWENHPEAMAIALRRHDELMRSTIQSAGGFVFKTVGDAFCAAFALATDAVEAARNAQWSLQLEPWPPDAPIRVRMALHTGECEERDNDYFGPTVNRTARLEATAHGGQIVMSQSTAELVRNGLSPGQTLVDLGRHVLKDMEHPEEVFQLSADGLPTEFPALRSRGADNPTNLTSSVSSFVGRAEDVAEVARLLDRARLVTLTGSGGVGKTRLAIEIGRTYLPGTTDGVWISELATVTDPAHVAAEVLNDLEIGEQTGRSALDTLIQVLATQNRLVILDNCEHVLGGCAALADAMARHCPEVRIVATSREPLRIEGEAVYQVPPLSLPPVNVDSRQDAAGSGAVALFSERAAAQASGFEVTDDNVGLVAAICRRLDGMPLALELASSRLRSMSLAQLHDRLEHRFGLLTGGSRVALPRQQTLKALVDWSYDLLSESERALFRRLSVFVDGFTLDDIAEWDVADLMTSLVDKCLVMARPGREDLRYYLQETLHQYGAERLSEVRGDAGSPPEGERVIGAHAEYFLHFAERAGTYLAGRQALTWIKVLDGDDLNLRDAMAHVLSVADGADRVLDQFWSLHRYWPESRQPDQTLALLDKALELAGADASAERMAKSFCCKSMLLFSIDSRLEREAAHSAVTLAHQAGDPVLEADVLARYSRSLAVAGDIGRALELAAEATAIARQLDDAVLLGSVLNCYASVLDTADDPAAESVYLEALQLVGGSGDVLTAQTVHNNYALILIRKGQLDGARMHIESALVIVGAGLTRRSAMLYLNLAWLFLDSGDARAAASELRAVLRHCRLHGTFAEIPYVVLGLACCATHLDLLETAAMLHGGADALLAAVNDQWEIFEATIRERNLLQLRERLHSDFDTLVAEGSSMATDQITKLALSVV